MSASAQRIVPQHPIEVIRSAVLSQRAAGARISIGLLGVHVVSAESPRWERDPRAKWLSPLGAVLLEVQPSEWDDPYDALAEVFETRLAYVEGLIDGMEKAEPDKDRAGTRDGRLYVTGWEQGYRFREEMLRGGFSR